MSPKSILCQCLTKGQCATLISLLLPSGSQVPPEKITCKKHKVEVQNKSSASRKGFHVLINGFSWGGDEKRSGSKVSAAPPPSQGIYTVSLVNTLIWMALSKLKYVNLNSTKRKR